MFHHLHPVLSASENGDKVKRGPNIEAYFFNLYYEIGSRISVFNPYIEAGVVLSRMSDKLSIFIIENKFSQVYDKAYEKTSDKVSKKVSTLIIEDKSVERESQKISLKNNFAYKFIFGSSFDLSESTKFDLE